MTLNLNVSHSPAPSSPSVDYKDSKELTRATEKYHRALVDEAKAHIEHLAQGVPGPQAERIRRGETEDSRVALIVRLTNALEAQLNKAKGEEQ